MKSIATALLLILVIGTIGADDLDSSRLIDYLLNLNGPVAPVVIDGSVVFTASSSYRRMGISFAHENYSKVHWYQKFMVPEDPAVVAAYDTKKPTFEQLYRDSGLLFYVEPVSRDMRNMDYRVVIDGLWMPDPTNPENVTGASGMSYSRVRLPESPPIPSIDSQDTSAGIMFSYRAAPGELITIGGSFNRWDPFMYELTETSPGLYCINLPLPPGTYQYVFFNRGERLVDLNNSRKGYTIDGKAFSEVEVK